MTKEIIWRLREAPTAESLQRLVSNGLLTKEEARQILFGYRTEEDRDKKSLEAEIKFLREMVSQLANNSPSRIVEVFKEIEKPFERWPWRQPYITWCSTANGLTGTATNTSNITGGNLISMANNLLEDFAKIKTF